jgi:beta-glucosidase-like glycosyl hydrolase
VAATFDRDLALAWGDAMGEEFRGKGSNVQLGPGMNVARVPTNGRNFEYTSGEVRRYVSTFLDAQLQCLEKRMSARERHPPHTHARMSTLGRTRT